MYWDEIEMKFKLVLEIVFESLESIALNPVLVWCRIRVPMML